MASTVGEDSRYAQRLVQAVVERLGPVASDLRVLDVSPTEPTVPPRPGLRSGRHLLITIGPGPGLRGPRAIGVHFSTTVPLAEATVATAGQVQDQVIEMSHEAVPGCPGHQHPLQAAVQDGVPSWVCPVDARHHVEPILPTAPG